MPHCSRSSFFCPKRKKRPPGIIKKKSHPARNREVFLRAFDFDIWWALNRIIQTYCSLSYLDFVFRTKRYDFPSTYHNTFEEPKPRFDSFSTHSVNIHKNIQIDYLYILIYTNLYIKYMNILVFKKRFYHHDYLPTFLKLKKCSDRSMEVS